MSVETMQELLIDELKDLYSAEKQIVRALPKLAKASTSQELQQALLQLLDEILAEEKAADKLLTGIAKGVNRSAINVSWCLFSALG